MVSRDPSVSPADTPGEFPRATPRPWEALDVEGGRGVYPWVGWTDPDGQIVSVVETEDCDEIDRDNVRLIVQAVNERAELLAVGERDKAEIAELRLMLQDAEADVDAGERDRRQIARLTEAAGGFFEGVVDVAEILASALSEHNVGRDFQGWKEVSEAFTAIKSELSSACAVLADEEDAPDTEYLLTETPAAGEEDAE